MFHKFGSRYRVFMLSTGALFGASSAFAVGAYDPITTAADWTAVVAAIIAISALVATVLVTRRGVKFLLGAIKS